MSQWILPLLLLGGNQQRTGRLTKHLLPLAIPGPPGQRFAFAAIFADQEIKKQEQVDLQVVKEAVKIGNIKDVAALTTAAPAIAKVYAGLKASDQASVVFGSTAAGKNP